MYRPHQLLETGAPMAGKGITMTDELREYMLAHSDPPRSDVHRRLMERTAQEMGDLSMMQIAAEQGPWLTFTARSMGVSNAVEVGTFTGYSALCIAEGLAPGGKLHCLDIDADFVHIGRPFWQEAGVADRIEVTIAPALETLQALPHDDPIDFAFIDADKENYCAYYEELLGRVAPGGLIVADNTLWAGAVLDESVDDSSTVAIRQFNDMVAADERVDSLMVNIGDGLMLARKRG